MAQRLPRARKDGLATEQVQDELLVYDLERDKAYCLNETAALVWKHCNGRRSAEDIARRVKSDTGACMDEKVVWYALDQLSRDRLLDGKIALPRAVAGMTRREHLRTLGKVAAIALPLVTAAIAPTAAEAATICRTNANGCLSNSTTCTSSKQCCTCCCKKNPTGNQGQCKPGGGACMA